MLLNYLYSNFLEEGEFAEINGVTPQYLKSLIEARVFPAPSYVYESAGRSVSFVCDFADDTTYRFHLRDHIAWFKTITDLGLFTEDRARHHFFSRYEEAKKAFFTSNLGQYLIDVASNIPQTFNSDHANVTWEHFLNGVYGVCTRDGQPESVFLKQASVLFIEQMIVGGPGSLSDSHLKLLKRTVAFLDNVESDFAPHEVPQVSRQRCIIDVNTQFFDKTMT